MPFGLSQLTALLSVVVIDVVLAGDNAVVVGLAAARLSAEDRGRVIVFGIAIATGLRIVFAYFAAELLAIIGLTLAGGILLLWVAWKMYRELRRAPGAGIVGEALAGRAGNKGLALVRIVLADVSMSLDNVLAVAGTARDHLWVLGFGLLLSVALTAAASTYIARLLDRHFWISWIGLGIVTIAALRMIWDGSAAIVHAAALFPPLMT